MNDKDTTQQSWEKVASLYDEKFFSMRMYDDSYDYFCGLLPDVADAKILDVGCGPGIISKYIEQKLPNVELHGIDYAPAMIDLANQNVPGGTFWVEDISKPFTIESRYHGIICGFVLPYLSSDEVMTLLSNISESMTDSGILYLSFLEGKKEDSGYITGSTGDRMYFYYHDKKHLERTLQGLSFVIKKCIKVLYTKKEKHTILIAQFNNCN